MIPADLVTTMGRGVTMGAMSCRKLARGARHFGLIPAIWILLCGVAASEARPDVSAPGPTRMAAPAQEPAGRLSKFEARHIRHSCRDEVSKSATLAGHKDFMTHCFQMHVSARHFARECKVSAEFKALDKSAKEDFIRACVSEKLKSFGSAQ
jgi:hypothetical protein